MDLSSRHLPDLSDISVECDFSNASFQIPANANAAQDLLLADDSFFRGMSDALVTPGARHPAPKLHAPLTLDELTPRSRRARAAPTRSSLRTRPNIPSPLKQQVTRDLSIALEDALSPLKRHDATFTIPSSSVDGTLLAAEDSGFFRSGDAHDMTFTDLPESRADAHEPLTLSQLTPGPSRLRQSPLVSPSSTPPHVGAYTFPTEERVSLTAPPPEDRKGLSEETAVVADESDGPCTEAISIAINSPPHATSPPPPTGASRSSDNTAAYAAIVASGSGSSDVPVESEREPLRGLDDTAGHVKRHTKPKRTVIEGGISKRPKSKLPVSRPARDAPQPTRTTRSHSTAVNKPRTAERGATKKRVSSSSHPDPGNGTQVPTVDDDDVLPVGLSAALVSYSRRSTAHLSDRVAAETGSVTELFPAVPESDVGRNQDDAERAQPSDDTLPGDTNREIDQQHSSAGTVSALSTAPDCTNVHLSARPAQATICEIPSGLVGFHLLRDPADSAVPPSPMRPSVKRRSSQGPGEEQPRKKGKEAADADADADDVFTTTAPRVAQKSTLPARPRAVPSSRSKPHVSASRTVSASHRSTRGIPNASNSTSRRTHLARSAPVTRAPADTTKWNSFTPTTSGRARSVHDHHLVDDARARTTTAASRPVAASRSGDALGEGLAAGNEPRRLPSSSDSAGSMFTRPGREPFVDTATHQAAKPEKPPFEFTFTLDPARASTGKADPAPRPSKGLPELKRALKAQGLLSLPDYTQQHTAQAHALAARRAAIVPVVPPPPSLALHTDARARERAVFEDGLRARRTEEARRVEEERRVAEREEERAVRALRRRAVPKANVVPEWYQHAPKRDASC